MSAAILLAEATLLPSGVDLSLFSILINAVDKREMLVQVNVYELMSVRAWHSVTMNYALILADYGNFTHTIVFFLSTM